MSKVLPSTTSVDVVVPVHNAAAVLSELIDQLMRQQVPEGVRVHWYLVDDASTDATPQVLQRMLVPQLRLLRLPRNRGRAAARNAGAAAGQGELILLLDSDCIPQPGMLSAHLAEIADGADISFGPVVGADDGFWAAYQSVVADKRAERAAAGEYALMTTANAMLRRALFERIGGFEEAYRGYGFEDRDLVLRLLQAGAKASYAKHAVARHRLEPDLYRMCEKMRESGVSTAALFRQRFAQAYRSSSFARFDQTQVGPWMRRLLDILAPRRGGLLRVTDFAVRRDLLPFSFKLLLVRACVGLSFYAGTMH